MASPEALGSNGEVAPITSRTVGSLALDGTETVAAFASASEKLPPEIQEPSLELAERLAAIFGRLSWGGGEKGLMGVIAEAFDKADRDLHGVTMDSLTHEVSRNGVQSTDQIGQRVHKIFEGADAVVTFPGGKGTAHELFTIEQQLRLGHRNNGSASAELPVVVLNAGGCFDWLPYMRTVMMDNGLMSHPPGPEAHLAATPDEAIAYLEGWRPEEATSLLVPDHLALGSTVSAQ